MQGKGQSVMQIQMWVGVRENWAGLLVCLPREFEFSRGGVNWNRCTEAQGQQLKSFSPSLSVCAEQLEQCCMADLTLGKFVAVLLLLSLLYGFIKLKAFWSLWVIFFSWYCMLFLNELASGLICHRFNYGTQSRGSCFFLILSKELYWIRKTVVYLILVWSSTFSVSLWSYSNLFLLKD